MPEFFAHGIPAPQGSKRLVRLRTGRVMMLEDSKRVMPWRAVVAAAAAAARMPLHEGNVEVRIVARWVRPVTHLGKDGSVKRSSPPRPGYADCDKLARAVCDALAGIAYRNDRQVVQLSVERRWCETGQAPGALISVFSVEDPRIDLTPPSE
jgi:Holliday junction resolvase RusA-like endonuclease